AGTADRPGGRGLGGGARRSGRRLGRGGLGCRGLDGCGCRLLGGRTGSGTRAGARRGLRGGRGLDDRLDDGLDHGGRGGLSDRRLGRGGRLGGRLLGGCLGAGPGGGRGGGGRGGGRRRGGGLQRVAVLLAETHLRGELYGRARRLDELAHLLELLENELALDSELLGEFVDSGLGHNSPSGLRPDSGCFSDRYGVCKLIASYSSSAHELLLQFLSVDHGWCARESRYSASGVLVIPGPFPPVILGAREKAFRR